MRINVIKTKKTIQLMALALALVLGLASAVAAAQPGKDVLVFEVLDVQVMPEYDLDYPQVLVIFQGALINKGSEPWTGELTFRAPKNADVRSACELSADPLKSQNVVHTNMISLGKAKVTEKGDYKEITYSTDKVIEPGKAYPFHMEWYYSGITGGPDKNVDFNLPLPFGADKVSLDIMEAARSSNFSSNLKEVSSGSGGSGTTVHRYEFSAVKADEPLAVQFSYTKADNNKSVVGSTAGRPAPGADLSLSGNQTVLWVALGMVVALGFFIFYGGSAKTASVKSKQPKPLKAGPKDVKNAPAAKGKNRQAGLARIEEEKKKARKLLLEGKISEETYREIVRDLENSSR